MNKKSKKTNIDKFLNKEIPNDRFMKAIRQADKIEKRRNRTGYDNRNALIKSLEK